MNSTGLWRLFIGTAIAIAIGLAGWTLNAVANMPKEYVLKCDFDKFYKENREDHKEILEILRKLKK